MLVSTVPVLLVGDVEASASWYRDRLGFAVSGARCRALSSSGVTQSRLPRQCSGGVLPHRRVAPGMWDAYVGVRDVEARRRELSRREVPIERGPVRMLYDCIGIEVVDPDGYAMCLGECG